MMGVVTSIEVQKKHANRRSIFIDGEFACGVDAEVIYLQQIKVGDTVDKDELAVLIKTETYKKARDSAFRLLSLRDRSSYEIKTKLTQKGLSEEIIDDVLQWLCENNFVNDKTFAEKWVAYRTKDTSKPSGSRKIKSELFEKGISPEIVAEVLRTLDLDTELGLAWKAVLKKLHIGEADFNSNNTGLSLDYAQISKLYAFLARKGFGSDVIRSVLAKLNKNVEI